MSPKVAETFRDAVSDSIINKLGLTVQQAGNLQGILLKWGIKSETQSVEGKVSCQLECPYANEIHPLLRAEHPVCPMSFMALGVIRSGGDREFRILENSLKNNGANLSIGKPTH